MKRFGALLLIWTLFCGFTWTKDWSSSDDGSPFSGSDLKNIQDDVVAQVLATPVADSSLSQITTAGKVSGAAITSLSSIPSGAGRIPLANTLRTYVGTFTREMAGTAGDVAYTGVGFTPRYIIFTAVTNGKAEASYGATSGASANYCNYATTSANTIWLWDTKCIRLMETYNTTSQMAVLKTFDADGFTLTWSIDGTPTTENMNVWYTAFE